jgi:hypothetical protein
MPAAAAIGPDGQIMRPRKGRPPKGGYPYPYPASTDPARTIYIGKNNARHWADLKTRLGYNGDVDFVSFLLRLAEERLRYVIPRVLHFLWLVRGERKKIIHHVKSKERRRRRRRKFVLVIKCRFIVVGSSYSPEN